MAGVVNTCPVCNERVYDMDPCCGLTGREVAEGIHPDVKKAVQKCLEKLDKSTINKSSTAKVESDYERGFKAGWTAALENEYLKKIGFKK